MPKPVPKPQLRCCRIHPSVTLLPAHRSRYSTAQKRPKSVAVLGGGITGLSAAWYLSRLAPTLPITLYEKTPRLGGWLRSKRVEHDGGSVLFEQGPRTLRPSSATGLVTLDMIRQLKLEDELMIVPKTSPAAKNRFIYYPDRLNLLPNSLLTALFSARLPVMRGLWSALLREPSQKRRAADLEDESVGSFFSRRFSRAVAENLVSSVLHGIYAGDVYKLSVKSLFPKLWWYEGTYGSVLRGMLAKSTVLKQDLELEEELAAPNQELRDKMRDASVYSFKGGIETLSKALTRELEQRANVTIRTSTDIHGITYTPGNELPLEVSVGGSTDAHSHIISTLYAPALNSLLPAPLRIPSLSLIPAVTVQVTNLHFPTPNLTRVHGFGYLLPRSVPASSNPSRALGVIFDSDSAPDPLSPGTKLTVMTGGHWWDGRATYPDDAEAVRMARDVLKRQLGIEEEPLATNVTLQRNCIPQYTVGHDERLRDAHEGLRSAFGRRLAVAGASYAGVGLNDCVRSARDVVRGLLEREGCTGLEGVVGERVWVDARGR